jgi:hypothetical protein
MRDELLLFVRSSRSSAISNCLAPALLHLLGERTNSVSGLELANVEQVLPKGFHNTKAARTR